MEALYSIGHRRKIMSILHIIAGLDAVRSAVSQVIRAAFMPEQRVSGVE